MTFNIPTSRKIFLYTLIGVLICHLAWWFLMIIALSPNIAGIENNTIYFVQRILDGQGVYTDPENPPFAIAQYNPLYYQLVAMAARISGTGPDDVLQLFLVNRVVSFLLLLSVAFSAGAIGRKVFALPVLHARISGALVFIFMGITSFARADGFALALYFPSLLLFLKGISSNHSQKQGLLWAGILAGLAWWAKQPALLLFVVCGGWLMIKRRVAKFLPYLAGFGIILLGGLLVIHATSGLDVYYKNVVKGIDNGIDLHNYFNVIIPEYLARGGLLFFLLMIVVIIALKKSDLEKNRFLSLLILFQFLFSFISSMRNGASANYFAEWWILVMLGAAASWPVLSRIAQSFDPRLIYLVGVVILVLPLAMIAYPLSALASSEQRVKDKDIFQKESVLAHKIKEETDGRSHFVFNNIFSPDSYLNNLLFREAVIPQNDIVTFGTWERKVFDYSLFYRQISNGALKLVVMKKNESRHAHLSINMDKFQLVDSLNEYMIYRHVQYQIPVHEE